ncbi:MAG: ribonuclease P protein component [Bacteroidota bacterium]|nr:ribonuclease P protein component [Bacteroidota bacterium]MDX5430618.1 ribonuclease P protein component [Bacteroidota bacterium]MDX5469370.1 ribonuclease P protein component [Bacteroidota bacterium]
MDRRFFFRKEERLSGLKPVQRLFTEKTGSIFIFPLKVNFLVHEDSGVPPLRVLFAVPKKRFRKAHHRNHVKRILREVYRKNAHLIREPLISKNMKMDLSISYVGEKMPSYQEVERIFLSIAERMRQLNEA